VAIQLSFHKVSLLSRRIAVFMMLLFLSNGYAAEWSLTSVLNSSLKYDDNIFMREDKKGDYQANITPTMIISRQSDSSEISLSAGYVLDRYETASQLDADYPFWHLDSGYQTERSDWQLEFDYSQSSSRNDAADDTGDFETNAIVTSKSVSPSYSFQLTDQDTLFLSASYSKRDYSTVDFNDNETMLFSSNWQHQFDERLNAGLSVSFSNIESKGRSVETNDDIYSIQLMSAYDLSDTWNMRGSLGLRQLQSEQTDLAGLVTINKDNGQSLGLDISYSGELNSANAGLSRSVSPSSLGDVNEVDRVNLNLSRKLSEELSINIQASYQVTALVSGDNNDKRKNMSLSSSINWQFSREVDLLVLYNYRQQKVSTLNVDTNANSNAIMLVLNYNWEGIRVSR